MALTSGFFNSLNGDRKYDAEDFGELFSNVLQDGIFYTEEGTDLQVVPNSSATRTIYIRPGRAWFNGIWVKNDSSYSLVLDEPDQNLARRDSIILKIDKTDSVRAASFAVVKGTPSSTATPPDVPLSPSENVYQYVLSDVRIPSGGASTVQESHIEDKRGTEQTPWAKSGLAVSGNFSDYSKPALISPYALFALSMDDTMFALEARNFLPELKTQMCFYGYDAYNDVVDPLGIPLYPNNLKGFSRRDLLARRTTLRGKNLGSSLSEDVKDAISGGSFNDIFIGDFFVEDPDSDNPIIWRIVDIDYWYDRGNPATTKHHIVVMPDKVIEDQNMNSSATTTGGYLGSAMHTTHIPSIKTNHIIPMFGSSNILTHSEYLINAVSSGAPSSGTHTNVDVLLPDEIMMFGCKINSPMSSGGTNRMDVKNYTISNRQLALFKYYDNFIWVGEDYWLRDVANSTQFCRVDAYGGATTSNASVSSGIRPVFGITGD